MCNEKILILCACMQISPYIYTIINIHLFIYIDILIYTHIVIYTHIFIYIYIYIHLYIYIVIFWHLHSLRQPDRSCRYAHACQTAGEPLFAAAISQGPRWGCTRLRECLRKRPSDRLAAGGVRTIWSHSGGFGETFGCWWTNTAGVQENYFLW